MHPSDVSPWAIRGIYLFAFVLVLSPSLDLFAAVWPLRPMELAWRYGFLGLTAGYVQTPLLGLFVALALAHWTENGALLKVLGMAMMLLAVILLLMMAMFMLDVMDMRALRAPEERGAVLIGGVLQQVKYGAVTLVLAAVGYGAMKTAPLYDHGGRGEAPGIVSTAK